MSKTWLVTRSNTKAWHLFWGGKRKNIITSLKRQKLFLLQWRWFLEIYIDPFKGQEILTGSHFALLQIQLGDCFMCLCFTFKSTLKQKHKSKISSVSRQLWCCDGWWCDEWDGGVMGGGVMGGDMMDRMVVWWAVVWWMVVRGWDKAAHVGFNSIKMSLDVCICIYSREEHRECLLILDKMEQTTPRLHLSILNKQNFSKTLH